MINVMRESWNETFDVARQILAYDAFARPISNEEDYELVCKVAHLHKVGGAITGFAGAFFFYLGGPVNTAIGTVCEISALLYLKRSRTLDYHAKQWETNPPPIDLQKVKGV